MRLFLLPISTRRTLIFCQRLEVTNTAQQSYLDKGTHKAAQLWASWEKKESGWQKKVVVYGNQALKRIAYEEWGLKSVPPLSDSRKQEIESTKKEVEVLFPSTLIPEDEVLDVLKTLATERQGLHKQNLIYSIMGMPIVAPFALVPVIPNLPFFYLVFRAYSHWRALSGGKHLEYLLDKKLLVPKPSPILDQLYATGKYAFNSSTCKVSEVSKWIELPEETMVLHESDGKRISETLEIPELYVELDRAVVQVEEALKKKKEAENEKTKALAAQSDHSKQD